MNTRRGAQRSRVRDNGRHSRSESPPQIRKPIYNLSREPDSKLNKNPPAQETWPILLSPPSTPQLIEGEVTTNLPRQWHSQLQYTPEHIRQDMFVQFPEQFIRSSSLFGNLLPPPFDSKSPEDTKCSLHTFESSLLFTDSPKSYDDSGSPGSIETDIESTSSNERYEKGDGITLAKDQNDLGAPQGSGSYQKPKELLSSDGSANHELRKRNHGTAFSDSADVKDFRPPVTDRRRQSSEEDSKPPFACPFYKLDIQQHQKCLRYQLRRIKDVKQHITRQHSQPEFYCARCYDVFEDAAQRDDHARQASCAVRALGPAFDGVSAEQRRKLGLQYVCRGKSAVDQWYYIWETLFPGRHRPCSVYVGNYVEEAAQLLQTVWRSQAAEIISWVSPAAGARGGDGGWCTESLKQVVESLLNRLVATSGPHADVGTPLAYSASTVSSSTTLPSSVPWQNRNSDDIQGNTVNCFDNLLLPRFYNEGHEPVVDPIVHQLDWESRVTDLQETNGLSFEGVEPESSGPFFWDEFHSDYNN